MKLNPTPAVRAWFDENAGPLLAFGLFALAILALLALLFSVVAAGPALTFSLIASVLAAWLGGRAKNPWLKALGSLALPSAIALGLLFVLSLAINYLPGGQNAVVLGAIEQKVIDVDEFLTKWFKPSPWVLVPLLIACLYARRHVPQWNLGGGVLWAKKWSGKTLAVVAVLANFTFFTDSSVMPVVARNVRARYEKSRDRKNEASTKRLSREAVTHALQNAEPETRRLTVAMAAGMQAAGIAPDLEARATSYLAESDLDGIGLDLHGSAPEPDRMEKASSVRERREEALAEERSANAEEDAERQEAKQDRELLNEIVSQVLSGPQGKLFEVTAGPILEHISKGMDQLAAQLGPYIGEQVKKYGEKLYDHAMDELIAEPATRFLNEKWAARAERLAAAEASPDGLQNEIGGFLSRSALRASAEEAKESERFSAEAQRAEREASARASSEQAQQHARLADHFLGLAQPQGAEKAGGGLILGSAVARFPEYSQVEAASGEASRGVLVSHGAVEHLHQLEAEHNASERVGEK